jgi:hypothetical protein
MEEGSVGLRPAVAPASNELVGGGSPTQKLLPLPLAITVQVNELRVLLDDGLDWAGGARVRRCPRASRRGACPWWR